MIFIFFLLFSFSASAEVDLQGFSEQGGIIFGKTMPGSVVKLDGQKLPVSPEGNFLLGFGREAKPKAQLEIEKPGGDIFIRDLAVAKKQWKIQKVDGLPEEKVEPDPVALARIEKEKEILNQALAPLSPQAFYLSGFQRPTEGRISGVFGSQRVLNGKPRAPHSGVDIAGPVGEPVKASYAGIVTAAYDEFFFTGKTIVIDHGQGLFSLYAHLDSMNVRTGDKVEKGTLIGTIGKTGRATGPHLHFGLILRGTRLNPELLFK